jgi:hypothetical protein
MNITFSIRVNPKKLKANYDVFCAGCGSQIFTPYRSFQFRFNKESRWSSLNTKYGMCDSCYVLKKENKHGGGSWLNNL